MGLVGALAGAVAGAVVVGVGAAVAGPALGIFGKLNEFKSKNENPEFLDGLPLIWEKFEITLEARDDDLHIVQEQILPRSDGAEKFPLYWIEKPSEGLSDDIRVAYNNFKHGEHKPHVACIDQIAIMCQLESPATFAHEHDRSKREIPLTIKRFQHFLENTLFLDPVPSLMRCDSYPEKNLRVNCSNLSGVLYHLWQQEPLREGIIEFIKSLPEQDVKNIQFFEDRRGRVALELIENFGGKERACPVELLSDGTLRVLAIAAAVLSAPKGSTVVLEEVDNGVHPSRAHHLLETMQNEAKRRNIRLLLTTHNPALMDALPDDALGDVVFCYRDPQEGDSRLVRLSDLPDYVELVVRGTLGDLVTHGIVDRFVKCPTTPEAKKQKALDWLAHLQGDDVL
ncbi:ATP-binding protein [Thiothrix subterranea]|nr:ATP-binding protein [Thiothrix subterranea]